jgi:hypothetical protein
MKKDIIPMPETFQERIEFIVSCIATNLKPLGGIVHVSTALEVKEHEDGEPAAFPVDKVYFSFDVKCASEHALEEALPIHGLSGEAAKSSRKQGDV